LEWLEVYEGDYWFTNKTIDSFSCLKALRNGAAIKVQIDAHLLTLYFRCFDLNNWASAAQVPATQKQGLLVFSLWLCAKKQKI
jgi:hypothetical protein